MTGLLLASDGFVRARARRSIVLLAPLAFLLALSAATGGSALVSTPNVLGAPFERGSVAPMPLAVTPVAPACTSAPFTDVTTGHVFCPEISWAKLNGIATGYISDGGFHPSADATRMAVAAFLARLSGDTLVSCTTPPVPPPFTDVPINHPFCKEIKWLKDNNITTGFADGSYKPGNTITRMAISAFLTRFAGASPAACGSPPFNDVLTTHPFCKEIKWMADNDITTGFPDGGYHPAENVTRMAAIAFIFRMAYLLDAAPAVTTTGGSTPYTEGDPATVIDGGLTITDTDDTNLESAQVRISSGLQSAEDVLAFANTASITGSYNSGTGVLTLTGSDTVANYESALRSITFDNTGTNPSASKTVEFKVYDGTRESNAPTQDLAISIINDPPVVTLSGSSPAYTEGGTAQAVDGGVTVTDADDVNLESATITITALTLQTGDVLNFTDQNGITGVFAAGVLSLSGSSSVGNYETALRSITFSTTNDDPTATRSVEFKVNDGSDDSNLPTKSIAVTAVDDGPANTAPASATVNEDTPLNFTAGNAVSVADPDVGAGSMEIDLSVTNGTLTMTTLTGLTFSVGGGTGEAAMTFTGTLTDVNNALATLRFDPTLNFPGMAASGIAVFSMTSDDQGNTGTGGPLSDTDGFNVTVNQVNDAPDAIDQALITSSSIKITIGAGDTGKLKDGASDVDDPNGDLTVSGSFTNVDPGATVSLTDAATGTYTYNPAAGFTGTDNFNYQVCDDAPLCDTASVAVTVNGVDLWFVDDSAAAGGTGRLTDPFDALSDLPAGRGTGDRIFLYSGTYANGHTLMTGEHLIGQPSTGSTFDALMGVSVPANGTLDARPSMGGAAATMQNTLTLATNSKVLGIDVTSTGNTALLGTGGLTGVDVGQAKLNTTTGIALSLNNVAGTVTLLDLDKNGSGTGISLTNVGAGVTVPSGATIQNTTTGAIFLDGGAGDFSYAGSISSVSAGREVTVQNKAVGSVVSFTGEIGTTVSPLGGTGIFLDNNDQAGGSGGSITFSGGVNLSTGSSAAFTATNGGNVNVTGTNTLTTTTATALNVTGTNIGASGMTFQSINVDGTDAAPTNGIVLNGTGSTAGLTITGNAGSCTVATPTCSGGTIRDTSGNGIDLIGTLSPSLTLMNVTSNLGNGIHGGDMTVGGNVTNATLSNMILSNNGDNAGSEDNIFFQGLVGTATWSNLDLSGGSRDNARVHNLQGTLTSLNVTGSTVHDNSTVGSNGLSFIADGTAVMTASVSTTNFTFNHDVGVLGQTLTGGTLTLTVTGGTFTNNFRGVSFEHASSGNMTGTFTGATISNTNGCTLGASQCGSPVNVFLSNQASSNVSSILRATITNNTISSAESQNAPGIWMHTGTPVRGHARLLITGNNISAIGNRGIEVTGGGCAAGICDETIDATIQSNTINLTDAASLDGIAFWGATGVGSFDQGVFCADVGGAGALSNTSSSFGGNGIRVRHRAFSTVRLPGYGGGANAYDAAAADAYLTARNALTVDTVSATSDAATGGGFITTGSCLTP